MGKIKGWTKTRERKDWVIWQNKHSGIEFWILTGQLHGSRVSEFNHWFVYRNAIVNAGTLAKFRTKAQAQKFAIQYMKTHPRG